MTDFRQVIAGLGDEPGGWWSVLTAVGLVGVGVPMAVSGGMPWWWFGCGLVAAAVAVLHREWQLGSVEGGRLRGRWRWLNEPRAIVGGRWGVEVKPANVLLELGALLLIAGVVAAMAPELVMGERPVSFDHPIHYTKAWRLEHEFLLDGRLRGWSHDWFAGYPAQYLYPIGADLLVVAIHWLTLGLVEFGTAYAWALAVAWMVRGWAIYRFAALGVGRWGGLAAALLWMTDTAAARIGGWHFAMEVGVWPMSLSVALGVWATAYLVKVVTRGNARYVAGFAALLGLSMWTHPFAVFQFAWVGPVALVAAWFAEDALPWLESAVRVFMGYVVGIALGLCWFLPFLTSTGEMDSNFGGTWVPMYEMGVKLFHGGLFAGTWGWITIVGAVGVVVCAVGRKFHAMVTGWLALGWLVLASSDFLAAFHLLEYSEGLQTTHFKRFIAVVKPYWIVAAVYVAVSAGRALRQRVEAGERVEAGRVKRGLGAFVVVAALAPVAVGVGNVFASKYMSRGLRTEAERATNQDRAALAGWFERNHAGPYNGEFFRVAYCCGYHDHSFVDFGTRIAYPLYKVGFSPATSFEHRIKSGDPEVLRALNVRYMISKRSMGRPYLEKVRSFGRLHLYRVKEWAAEPFVVMGGDGSDSTSTDGVRLTSFSPERIVLEVSESAVPSGGGRLRVNVSNFSRWSAWRNGEWLKISETSIPQDDKTGFMTVPLEEAGRYVFEFERTWGDWLAWLLGIAAGLAIIGLLLADRRVWWPAELWAAVMNWLEGLQETLKPHASWIATVSAAVVILTGAYMAAYPPAMSVEHIELPAEDVESVSFDAAQSLSDAQVGVRKGGRFEACRQVFGRFVCDGPLWKQPHVRVEDFGFEYDRYRCIWSHPVPAGPTEFVFQDVPVAEGMLGWFGIAESGSQARGAPVTLSVAVDGVKRYSGETTQDETLHGFELPMQRWVDEKSVDVKFSVRADKTGMRHFCFNAQTVRYDGPPPKDVQTKVPDIPRASGLRP